MEYFLGKIRFLLKIEYDFGMEENIEGELSHLVKASDKDLARIALLEYWEKENNGAVLLEARIYDTIFGK